MYNHNWDYNRGYIDMKEVNKLYNRLNMIQDNISTIETKADIDNIKGQLLSIALRLKLLAKDIPVLEVLQGDKA